MTQSTQDLWVILQTEKDQKINQLLASPDINKPVRDLAKQIALQANEGLAQAIVLQDMIPFLQVSEEQKVSIQQQIASFTQCAPVAIKWARSLSLFILITGMTLENYCKKHDSTMLDKYQKAVEKLISVKTVMLSQFSAISSHWLEKKVLELTERLNLRKTLLTEIKSEREKIMLRLAEIEVNEALDKEASKEEVPETVATSELKIEASQKEVLNLVDSSKGEMDKNPQQPLKIVPQEKVVNITVPEVEVDDETEKAPSDQTSKEEVITEVHGVIEADPLQEGQSHAVSSSSQPKDETAQESFEAYLIRNFSDKLLIIDQEKFELLMKIGFNTMMIVCEAPCKDNFTRVFWIAKAVEEIKVAKIDTNDPCWDGFSEDEIKETLLIKCILEMEKIEKQGSPFIKA